MADNDVNAGAPMAFLQAGEMEQETNVWIRHFGEHGSAIEKLFLPSGGLTIPETKVKKLLETWSTDDWPYLQQALNKLPTQCNETTMFNVEDFLTRVKRHRGTLTRSVGGFISHKVNWKELVAKELKTQVWGCSPAYFK